MLERSSSEGRFGGGGTPVAAVIARGSFDRKKVVPRVTVVLCWTAFYFMEGIQMANQLSKTYASQDVEQRWYSYWEEHGFFKPNNDKTKASFSIVMPPPNVTGRLHMGHAMDNTMQDILIRFKRLQGYNTLWLPGTDHAGIATQAKVEDALRKEGKSKEELGREAFVERCWAWKEEYGHAITEQIRKLGASCDWSQERFTMDNGCSRAVREAFVTLYDKGLIYQGDYIVNWCPHCHTTISDIEVEHKEQQGELYYLNYMSEDGEGFLTIATTRPETIFGDVAVAVHPDDERYQHLIGKKVLVPILERPIPVIADAYVDREFGTGAVKITPSHDINDFEMGQRHGLPQLEVMDESGVMNEHAGPYIGMDRFECRKQVIADLTDTPSLAKIESYENVVGHCYRCDTVIEPRLSKQWFVKMKPLAEPALALVQDGHTQFVPERFSKIYIGWMENIRDWCISRQLWWGHRIPVWYCQDCGQVIVAKEDPTACPHCGSQQLKQDEDVLDTWFSSGLWPYETLGWPDNTDNLKTFFPTNVLVTGRDIIFFWVARMIFSSLEMTGQKPFEDVLIHGLVLDDKGRKMSKSLGNGIDPLEEIGRYGADALRMTLITGTTPGNDTRYRQEKIEAARNFTNKLWNAARFVLMNLPEETMVLNQPEGQHLHDQWILSRYESVAKHVTTALEHYDLGEAARSITDFVWDEFCDWYIELAKPRLYGHLGEEAKAAAQQTAAWVLRETCVLLHPIMPFITEEIWQALPHTGDSIMVSAWPNTSNLYNEEAELSMQKMIEGIRAIRSLRHDMNVPMGKRATLIIKGNDEALYRKHIDDFKQLAFASEVLIGEDAESPEKVVSVVSHGAEFILPLEDLIDLQAELSRLEKEHQQLLAEIQRGEKKLANKGFVDKAPEAVVLKEREKLEGYRVDEQTLKQRLDAMKKMAQG